MKGRKYVDEFKILKEDWHMSDHSAIMLSINMKLEINLSSILLRAHDLNYSHDYLLTNKERIENDVFSDMENDNTDQSIKCLDRYLEYAHKLNGAKI